jgi:hypothetical protein
VNVDIARCWPRTRTQYRTPRPPSTPRTAPNGLTVTYAAAGRLVAAYAAYTTALIDVIDRRDPGRAECQCEVDLAVQGRIRALHEMRQKVHTH